MPTSSIFTNIVINDPEKVEEFIDALEASSHDPHGKRFANKTTTDRY